MSPIPWADDPTIADDAILWRRISSPITRDADGNPDISSANFRTEEMSVHLAVLADAADILTKYPSCKLSAITAGAVRREGCVVVRDPLENDPSHTLVVLPGGQKLSKTQAKRIARGAILVD